MNDVSAKIEQFFARYPKKVFAEKQILIHANHDPETIFYLVSGTVSQYDISYRGDEVVVNMFKPGAFFPMIWAITKKPNQYFFGAATDIEVRVAPCQEVLTFLQDNPDVTYDLLARLYIGVDGLLGRMSHLMAGSARSRLLYELVITAKRFGTMHPDGSCSIAITESDLAARAGLSRETVSRELQKMVHAGMLTTSRAGITIADLTAAARDSGLS